MHIPWLGVAKIRHHGKRESKRHISHDLVQARFYTVTSNKGGDGLMVFNEINMASWRLEDMES